MQAINVKAVTINPEENSGERLECGTLREWLACGTVIWGTIEVNSTNPFKRKLGMFKGLDDKGWVKLVQFFPSNLIPPSPSTL